MSDRLDIRESTSTDLAALQSLYPDAFPDEDLLPLVRDLLQQNSGVLSLVGVVGGNVVGHVIFTRSGLAGSDVSLALLGPLAVASAWQGRGFASTIVRNGLKRSENDGVIRVCVLGDPAYYARFGFLPETDIAPPYPLLAEWRTAWQSIGLGQSDTRLSGTLRVPQPWKQPALWGP